MRLLITGGTGYLGRAIVRACVTRGHDVIVFGRTASRSGLPGTSIDGDIRERAAVIAAARGCDAICHAAALVSVWRRDAREFDRVNVDGLRHVLDAAATHGVHRLLYASSFLALPPNGGDRPTQWNDYQRTKVIADRLATSAAESGVPLIRLYPGVIYGPGPLTEGNFVGRLVSDHLTRRLPGLIGAERVWSYAWIDDVATGFANALEQAAPGDAYHLGGVNAPQLRLFEIVRDKTGRALPRRIPDAAAALVARLEQAKAALFGIPPRLTPGTLEILKCGWALDSDQAARDLGYQITPLEVGMTKLLADLVPPSAS
jgi:farnesol dehydrogenase